MNIPNQNNITSIYQSYLNSFSKDFLRSLDNERVNLFVKSYDFIKLHNDNINGNSDTINNDNIKLFNSKTNPSKSNHQSTYFLRVNQFTDLSQTEIDSMFIKDAPTFDSIDNYRRILEKIDVKSEINEYFQYNLRRRKNLSTEWYDIVNKDRSSNNGNINLQSSPSTPASLSSATFNWASSNNPKQRSILPSGIRNQGK